MSYTRHYPARRRLAGFAGLGATTAASSATDLTALAAAAKQIIANLKSGGSAGGSSGASSGGSSVAAALTTVSAILSDPAWPEVACRVGQLHAIENRLPVPTCPNLAQSSQGGGIGLRKVVPLLRGVVYAERNPWVKPAAVGVILGVPLLLGYLLGRK